MADYNVKKTGTKTSGTSVSFADSQCYPTLKAASDELIANGSNGDRIVFDSGIYVNDGTDATAYRITATDAAKTFTVTSRGGSIDDVIIQHTSLDDNTGLRINPNNSGTPLHNITFSNMGIASALTYPSLSDRPVQISNDPGTVSFESVRFANLGSTHSSNSISQGRMIRTTGAAKTVELTDCIIDNYNVMPAALSGTIRSPMFVVEDNVTLTLTNTDVQYCTFSGHGSETSPAISVVDSGNLNITGGTWQNITLTTEDETTGIGSMVNVTGTGDCAIANVIVRDNYYRPGAAQNISCGFFSDNASTDSSQNHIVSGCTFANNIVDPVANNRLGGLARAQGQPSFVTVNDCIAEYNTGFFGALVDVSAGGACEINRCIARYNKGGVRNDSGENINGVGIYIGGGAEDCTINSTAVYGHSETYEGAALYVHNSDSPGTPGPRTVTFNHCSFVNNGDDAILIFGATETFTVNFNNCVFDSDIVTGGTAGTVLTLNFTNCATSAGATMAATISGSVATLNETDTMAVSNLLISDDAKPLPGSPLLNAGANTAITTDLAGETFDATNPSIGAYQNPTPAGYATSGAFFTDRAYNSPGVTLLAGGTANTITASGTFDTCTITVEESPDNTTWSTVTTFTAAGNFDYTPAPNTYVRATLSSVGASTSVTCSMA